MIVGIGVDLEEVERIRSSVESHGERFLKRVYTPRERAYVEERAHRYERYAVRFAAKEAAMKALGTGWDHGVSWQDVEIVNEDSGRPLLELTGRARVIADELGVTSMHVSLSHTRKLAIAQVVLEATAA